MDRPSHFIATEDELLLSLGRGQAGLELTHGEEERQQGLDFLLKRGADVKVLKSEFKINREKELFFENKLPVNGRKK